MGDSSGAIWRALNSGAPISVLFYGEPAELEALLQELELATPAGVSIKRAPHVAAAFTETAAIVALVPDDEVAAIDELDLHRDRMLVREWPLVLCLVRGGEGERKLPEAPSLGSWLRGHTIDPARLDQADVIAARRSFLEETGLEPAAWLAGYRAGNIPDTLETNLLLHRALFLVESSQ